MILTKKLGFNLAEDLSFFGDHLNLNRKTVPILVKTSFFGDHHYLATKTDSI